MKAVHFGAGNIGRGFIGLLLSEAGYRVTFVDVSDTLVSLLQERGEYTVLLAGGDNQTKVVRGVTAINGKRMETVAEAVAQADLVTTAVGVQVLPAIAGAIARGIELRLAREEAAPLHIIACENTIGGSTQLKAHVYERLSEATRDRAEAEVAFPDAAVDRIVPLQRHEDPLAVTVEPFYEWVVDRSALLPGATPIAGVHYVDGLEPYIERKLFTVNTGHCCAAYLGYVQGFATIQQAMTDAGVAGQVEAALNETGALLVSKHGFDSDAHAAYIAQILERFRNPYLTDEVARVGRSPLRKLSPNDRLVRPALQATERGLPADQLATAMGAALLFDVADDPEAAELQAAIQTEGVAAAFARYTGIAKEHPLFAATLASYERLKQSRVHS